MPGRTDRCSSHARLAAHRRCGVRRAARRSATRTAMESGRHRRRDVVGRFVYRWPMSPRVRRSRSGARRRPIAGRVLPHAGQRRRATPLNLSGCRRPADVFVSIESSVRTCAQLSRCVPGGRAVRGTAGRNGLQRNHPRMPSPARCSEDADLVVGDRVGKRDDPEKTRIIETGSVSTTRSTSTRGASRRQTARLASTSHSVVASVYRTRRRLGDRASCRRRVGDASTK